jgi:hypothetical protein
LGKIDQNGANRDPRQANGIRPAKSLGCLRICQRQSIASIGQAHEFGVPDRLLPTNLFIDLDAEQLDLGKSRKTARFIRAYLSHSRRG